MMNEWIATAERLPEVGDRVLIFSTSPATGASRIHLAWRAIPYEEAETWWWETSRQQPSSPVVPAFTSHWMPLPAFPNP
jgi:hypothetical protein